MVLYVIVCGPAPDAELGVPFGNDQLQEDGLHPELSVNITVLPTITVVGVPEKSATTSVTVI